MPAFGFVGGPTENTLGGLIPFGDPKLAVPRDIGEWHPVHLKLQARVGRVAAAAQFHEPRVINPTPVAIAIRMAGAHQSATTSARWAATAMTMPRVSPANAT